MNLNKEASGRRAVRVSLHEEFRPNGVAPIILIAAILLITLKSAEVSAQQEPTTGYASVNGVNMYYEVHGSG